MNVTRRSFFKGAAASAAFPFVAHAMMTEGVDPNLSVFLSDIHVSGVGVKGQPTYQNPLFEKAVDQVLAMRPRPKRVVVFGDIALWVGRHEDYEASLPGLKRLRAAGLDVILTTGNHDHRAVMAKYHPEQAASSPVPGRFVSVVDLGSADLFLMDTLKENEKGEGFGNAVDGALDQAQQDWLLTAAKTAKRPFFVGAHHPVEELKFGKTPLIRFLDGVDRFAGYIHGHNHRWYHEWHHVGYSRRRLHRSACLPSTGWWGDIGFAVMRTEADRAELTVVENDFFFPKPLDEGETRPIAWDQLVAEARRGGSCVFFYQREG